MEIPLSPYDSCRLIASNLYNLVKDKYTKNAVIDFELAYKVFYEAQIIGDILVDLEAEYVQKIIDITTGDEQELWTKILNIGLAGRRTGVGLTGYADMCAALGVNYGDEGITSFIMKLKMQAELDATTDLAIINGSFPSYNRNLEFDNYQETDDGPTIGLNKWYQFLINTYPEQFQKMLQYSRRNVSFSTIAPTGTISMLAGTSSGCEPVFSLYYKRRKKCNPGDKADFTDQNGIGYTEHNVIHGSFKDWYTTQITEKETGRILDVEQNLDKLSVDELDNLYKISPWFNNTANFINPYDRIRTQSIMQRYTTHSISSTINLPEDSPKELIDLLYKEAWKHNLKGITVYREGSRSGILINHKEEKPIITERPLELECKVLRFKNDKKNWIAFIGILNDTAYEVFSGVNDIDELPIPSYIESGKILKVSTDNGSRYDFSYLDKYGYTNTIGGLNRVFEKEFWNYARFVSALLHEGTKIQSIIKIIQKLEFKNKSLNSWQFGMIRALKQFIPDGEVSKELCPECNSSLIYESGCVSCKNCGWSKCS